MKSFNQIVIICCIFGSLLVQSCSNSSSSSASTSSDFNGFKMEKVSGNGMELASKMAPEGFVSDAGYVFGGKKNGMWNSYYEDGRPRIISNYIDGKLNGIYLEITMRGQIELQAMYKNDQLDGHYAKYKFGRPIIESDYKNGKLDGIYKEYGNDGKVQKEVGFKNGLQDGKMRYFDENGNVTLEYEYKNGEKLN